MQEYQSINPSTAQNIYQSTCKKAQWRNLILNILGGQATLIADIGLGTGLFQAIDQASPHGIDDLALARKLGLAPRYVQVWCQAAYAFKLLELDDQTRYRLTPDMASLLLDPHDPLFMGGRIRVFATLYEDFRLFPQYLSSGDVVPKDNCNSYILAALTDMTRPDSEMITEMVLPQADGIITKLEEQGGVILDIGVGSGAALIHYSRRFPKAQIVGLDLDPSAVKQSRQSITEAGLANRIIIRQDDANLMKDQCVYDLITMNLVLHETGGPSEYLNVLRRVRQALKPGGIVVISELPYPDSVSEYRNRPLFQMLAGLQLHEALSGGGKITMKELRGLLEGTGFSHVRVPNQPIPYRFVMLAEKQG